MRQQREIGVPRLYVQVTDPAQPLSIQKVRMLFPDRSVREFAGPRAFAGSTDGSLTLTNLVFLFFLHHAGERFGLAALVQGLPRENTGAQITTTNVRNAVMSLHARFDVVMVQGGREYGIVVSPEGPPVFEAADALAVLPPPE